MKRILFVDDETLILQAIQRSLRGMREEWDMVFAASPAEALEKMREGSFDLVVSDMRMPGMDGVALLEKVKSCYPQTVRFILSGQCDRELILRAAGPAHQFLSKPCEIGELKSKVARALAFGDTVADPAVRSLVSGLTSVPSPPDLYLRVTEEIQSRDPSGAKVGKIVARDPSMTAKILQMVNSSFFGLRCRIASAEQAVNLLGLDMIGALVLSAHVFSRFDPAMLSQLSLQTVGEHAVLTGALAKKLARAEKVSENLQDACFTAGILHDLGKLVLGSGYPAKYRQSLALAKKEDIPDWKAEREVFSCTHADAGAYLLGIWGLPAPVVEAVAWHHWPSDSVVAEFHPVLAAHVAAAFVENMGGDLPWERYLDQEFLGRLGVSEGKKTEWTGLLWEALADAEIGVPQNLDQELSGVAK